MKKITSVLLCFFCFASVQCSRSYLSVENMLGSFVGIKNGKILYERSVELSKGGDSYQFMSLRSFLGSNNAVIQRAKDTIIIEYQMSLIENIIDSSTISKATACNNSPYLDSFRTWLSYRDDVTHCLEVPLYESYVFFYVVEFLYLVRANGWASDSSGNMKRWLKVLSFVEKNIWAKWHERSLSVFGNPYSYFLRSRTHMGAHWAGISMYLNLLTCDEDVKLQTSQLVVQYDTLLRRNFKVSEFGYVWNSTYDDTDGTYALKSSDSIIQDVSHGNHVVSYIVAAYELGGGAWTLQDLLRLSYTMREFVYDKERNLFKDNVDGSIDPVRTGAGNFVADGWVKLAKYDKSAREMFYRFEQNIFLKKYNQELQFRCNLYGK